MFQGITFDYAGATTLVTGGTSGIGLACAQAYRAAGAKVIVTGRRARASDYDADLQGITYRQLDVARRDDLYALAGSLTKLDILVNNAGGSQGNEWEADAFDESVSVNLASVFHLSLACKELLAASSFPGAQASSESPP
ncbi:MAG: SDR family oxidoreductase [Halioglobus sp.]